MTIIFIDVLWIQVNGIFTQKHMILLDKLVLADSFSLR